MLSMAARMWATRSSSVRVTGAWLLPGSYFSSLPALRDGDHQIDFPFEEIRKIQLKLDPFEQSDPCQHLGKKVHIRTLIVFAASDGSEHPDVCRPERLEHAEHLATPGRQNFRGAHPLAVDCPPRLEPGSCARNSLTSTGSTPREDHCAVPRSGVS